MSNTSTVLANIILPGLESMKLLMLALVVLSLCFWFWRRAKSQAKPLYAEVNGNHLYDFFKKSKRK